MKRAGSVVCAASVVTLVLFGCARASPGEEAETSLTISYGFDERLLGPTLNMPSRFLAFEPLVAWNDRYELEGRLARTWEHSPDYRTWTVHLRSDVRWHDGVPFTAHDVKFTLDLLARPDVAETGSEPPEVRVLDDSTYSVSFRRPDNPLDDWTWTVYFPRHLLHGLDPARFHEWEFWIRPVGNGPFRYVRHVPKTMVELEANPDFYDGKPAIDRLVIKFGEQGLTELLSGNVDVAEINPAEIPKIAADPRFRVYYQILPDVAWLSAIFWNHDHPAVGDARVRKALTHAVDRRELLRVLNLPGDLPLSDALFTPRQYHRGDVPAALPYDPARASALLDEAGWRDIDGDGIRERDGKALRFTLLVGAGGGPGRQMAVYIQAALRRVGVRMEIQTLDIQLLRQRVRGGAFDAVVFPFYNHIDGHLNSLAGGAGYREEASRRRGVPGYANAEVARLLRSVKETAEPAAVDSIYRELAPHLLEDLPVTFLVPQVGAIVAHRRVRGLESPFRAAPMRYMERLWIEEP